jgi:hypothetical protein
MEFVVALDPGYGNTKVRTPEGLNVLQSAIARPRVLGMAAEGVDVSSRPKTVRLEDSTEYVAGPGAWSWGNPENSMDYSDIASQKRLALFFSSFAQIHHPGFYEVDLMVMGLPVPLLQDELQAEPMIDALKVYKGRHSFVYDGSSYMININRVRVLPQPVGAYANYSLDENGHLRRGISKEEVAVMDLGMNTLDLYVIRGFEAVPRFIGGDKLGVRRLLENLNGRKDIEELDADLRAGRLSVDDTQMDNWLISILGSLERNWRSLKNFDAVIPTGGGSAVLGTRLSNALAAKGAAVHWPKDPVTANVDGLYRWGVRII